MVFSACLCAPDNVILGKRLRTKGSPAVGVPRISRASTSAASFSDDKDNDDSREEDRGKVALDSSLQGLLETRQILHPVRCNDYNRVEDRGKAVLNSSLQGLQGRGQG